MERGLEREGKRETKRSMRGKERIMVFFLHSGSPFSSNSKQSPLCAAIREMEVIASAFHRQAPIHSSGQLPPNRQPRRKSSSPTRLQECSSHVFVSRMTLLSSHQNPPPPKHAYILRAVSLPLRFPFTAPSVSPPLPLFHHVVFTLSPCCRLLSLPALSVLQLVVLKVWSVGCLMGEEEEAGGGGEPEYYPKISSAFHTSAQRAPP